MANQDLCLSMSVPHSDNLWIASNEKWSSSLLPVHDDTTSFLHLNNLAQPSEGADHLDMPFVDRRVIIAIKTNNSVRFEKLMLISVINGFNWVFYLLLS